ncbi:VOC family protein [Planctomycetota bacterium]|nr:VOC family protein [Planctomycetota bacterium]
MNAIDIDHAVLWVDDPEASLTFYVDVLGLAPVRVQEFRAGEARFPSVRLNERTIFDLMGRAELFTRVQEFTGGGGAVSASPVNHICLSMSRSDYEVMSARLVESGVELRAGGENVFGAQGYAIRSVYFSDPDGNVLEMRYYEDPS